MNVLADVFRCPAGTVERAGVGGGKYCVTEPPGDSGSPPSPLLVSGDDGGGGGTLVAVVGTVILLILIACFVPGYGIQASKARQINNDERQKDESGLTATETTGEGDLKIDRMYPAGSSFSAKEADDLASRYSTNYGDVGPALQPIAFKPQTATAGGDWRAAVAMYRAERDAKTSVNAARVAQALPDHPTSAAPTGAENTLVRVEVLQGTKGITDPAERRRRIAENLGQLPTKETLQFVAADGTLC